MKSNRIKFGALAALLVAGSLTAAVRNGLQQLIGSVALPAETPEMRRTD